MKLRLVTRNPNPFVQIFRIWPPEGKFGGFKLDVQVFVNFPNSSVGKKF
jgi:hypothetical protein